MWAILLSGLFGLLTNVIAPIFKVLLPYLLCAAIGFYFGYQWNSAKQQRLVNFETIEKEVKSIESATALTVKSGLFNRQSRSVTLWGIDIPDTVAKDALTRISTIIIIGDAIKIEIKQGNRIGNAAISGIVTASNGVNCNLELLKKGLAKATIVDSTFLAAQTEAQKAKLGIWQVPIGPNKPKPWPWPFRETQEVIP